jgi:hypothetical protein
MTFRWVSQEAAVERWRGQQRLLCELEERVQNLFAAVGLPLARETEATETTPSGTQAA